MQLITADNKKISAKLYETESSRGWLILVHMMPATKESWDSFATEAAKFGYESVAVDLRGHGASEGGPAGYQDFSDEDHGNGVFDLEAAWDFLKNRGADPARTFLVGASIGANLSLNFLSEHKEFTKAVLLSAGVDYHGLESKQFIKKLAPGQAILLVASKDDGDNAADNVELYEAPSVAKKELIVLENGGHGTKMLAAKELDLTGIIIEFLESGHLLAK